MAAVSQCVVRTREYPWHRCIMPVVMVLVLHTCNLNGRPGGPAASAAGPQLTLSKLKFRLEVAGKLKFKLRAGCDVANLDSFWSLSAQCTHFFIL
jgi:hypothetical protein